MKEEPFRNYKKQPCELFEKRSFLSRPTERWCVEYFYVNPVDWLRPYDELGSDELAKGEGIGLVHIGWDGINLLIDNPQYNPNQIGTKGWNYTYADIEAIEEYRGTAALENYKKQLIRTGHTDEYGFDYYRQDGFVFYELPQLKEQLGVFNWWW